MTKIPDLREKSDLIKGFEQGSKVTVLCALYLAAALVFLLLISSLWTSTEAEKSTPAQQTLFKVISPEN
ncbi:hypothetical protein S7335_284 [Synechococcus sp. PCC 7335]|uniref:hypothetical protein n=1 Tax=Synechococcus sp. (strain ATCC 29403 / PCC 7335) TaxID=91464 RepID=UPI00017EE4AF|nr:hypothetical protein [Synechococcus sp. PCC 7335]EDX83106.1 hypothetical protein S7335_284 [Synechococcus sp. PCC 7335]